MQRLRTLHSDEQYTQVPNEAIDDLPDLESLGLLSHILRHDDRYHFDMKTLVERKKGVTRRTASKARATLIEHGYIVDVKFRHTYRGLFATDVYRSRIPHTAANLEELAQRYLPGTRIQIPAESEREAILNSKGDLLMREVTITWARIDSWRGEEVVTSDGQLVAKKSDNAA